MTLALLLAYIHLVSSVLLVGYFLFWLIMTIGLERLEPAAEVAPLTAAMLAGARWPPAVVPWTLRLTLPGVGWTFLSVLVLTGLAASLTGRGLPGRPARWGSNSPSWRPWRWPTGASDAGPRRGSPDSPLGLALGIVVVSVLLPR